MKRYLNIYLVLGAFLLVFSCSVAQQVPGTNQVVTYDTTEITLLFAGDVMGHMPQINSAYDSSTGTYNFNPVFDQVKPIVSNADIAIANLETTLAGTPYSGYPQFSAPDSLATALKNAGFDILITANNHCIDRGADGLKRTVVMLDSFKIPHTGTFINDSVRNATYPLITSVKGIKLAILNYTYGTNGLVVRAPFVVNYIDTAQVKKDLTKAKLAGVDYTIVTVHWGIEYERKENQNQRNIASFFLKNGADMVIGSHPHVVQPIVKYYNSPDSSNYNVVVYSLGNYVSNQRDRYKDGGLMVNVKLRKVERTKIAGLSYVPVWVFKGMFENRLQYKLFPMNKALPDWLDADAKAKADTFYRDTKENLVNIPVSPTY